MPFLAPLQTAMAGLDEVGIAVREGGIFGLPIQEVFRTCSSQCLYVAPFCEVAANTKSPDEELEEAFTKALSGAVLLRSCHHDDGY